MKLTNNEGENLINYFIGKVLIGFCAATALGSAVLFLTYKGVTYMMSLV